jgi:hypothetical protein
LVSASAHLQLPIGAFVGDVGLPIFEFQGFDEAAGGKSKVGFTEKSPQRA